MMNVELLENYRDRSERHISIVVDTTDSYKEVVDKLGEFGGSFELVNHSGAKQFLAAFKVTHLFGANHITIGSSPTDQVHALIKALEEIR